MIREQDITPGAYKHSKSGKLYEVIGVAFHTETAEKLVVYKPLYESDISLFTRPLAMFLESVVVSGEYKARFQKID